MRYDRDLHWTAVHGRGEGGGLEKRRERSASLVEAVAGPAAARERERGAQVDERSFEAIEHSIAEMLDAALKGSDIGPRDHRLKLAPLDIPDLGPDRAPAGTSPVTKAGGAPEAIAEAVRPQVPDEPVVATRTETETEKLTAAAGEPAEAPAPEAVTATIAPTDAASPEAASPEAATGTPTAEAATLEMKSGNAAPSLLVIDADREPLKVREAEAPAEKAGGGGPGGNDLDNNRGGGGGGGGNGGGNASGTGRFHKRVAPVNFVQSLRKGLATARRNLLIVMAFTVFNNVLVLAIPVYLFQISDRVLTSRSIDTLVMLTGVVLGAVLVQTMLDAVRRFILMRTAVEVEAQLGAPILSAAARASLHGNGREYHVLSDLQQLRSFITSGTLLSFLDAPIAPIFIVAVFLVHPHLGFIVVLSSIALLVIALINQRATARQFGEASAFMSRANLHLDSMSRNSQIINALAMIPEAVKIWGRDTASSLRAQVAAQDRNIIFASLSKGTRLVTQVTMLGWGAYLAIEGQLTGGMVIAASIIAGRALAPIEGAIEGWNQFLNSRASYGRIAALLHASPLNFQRLNLPNPEGRLDVERILFVPPPNKKVILNGISFSLSPGDSLAIIGSSGAGKTTLGKMLVGSILPTSGNVRLDLMDLRNWDQRQFGENIGYLPQDVQLFPATIKANIGRMREDASDEAIYNAAKLADVHELIASFPQGYETFVTADGSPLSGGQKQRIALARAFFGNPKLVVLDEPNSNLDGMGEMALARALVHAKKEGITVVTITQRPSLLKCVDKILVLNNGAVTMFGTREDVLRALADNNPAGSPTGNPIGNPVGHPAGNPAGNPAGDGQGGRHE